MADKRKSLMLEKEKILSKLHETNNEPKSKEFESNISEVKNQVFLYRNYILYCLQLKKMSEVRTTRIETTNTQVTKEMESEIVYIIILIHMCDQKNTLTKRIRELEYDNARLKELIQQYSIYICKYYLYRGNSSKFDDMRRDLTILQGKMREYGDENQSLKKENQNLKKIIAKNSETVSENKRLQEQNEKLQLVIENLQKQLNDTEERIRNLPHQENIQQKVSNELGIIPCPVNSWIANETFKSDVNPIDTLLSYLW